MNLTLRQLTVYVHVARGLSFTSAAEELRIAQSVVSRTVRDVERAVGAQLLSRDTRNVRLTPEGAQLLRLAERVLRVNREAGRAFDSYLRGEEGTVDIATLPSVAGVLLPSIITSFMVRFPRVHLRILDGLSESVIENVESGAAELGITTDERLPAGLQAHSLVTDRMEVLLPPAHPLTAQGEVTWAQLADQPFIAMSAETSVRMLTDQVFAAIGAQAETMIEAGSIVTVAGLVAAGLGLTALPSLVHPLLAFAGLASRSLVAPVVERRLAIITRADRPLAPAAARFAEHLEKMAPIVASSLLARGAAQGLSCAASESAESRAATTAAVPGAARDRRY